MQSPEYETVKLLVKLPRRQRKMEKKWRNFS